MKRLVILLVALCAANLFAMPTKAELEKAQPLVVELMAPAMDAFKGASVKERSAAAVKIGDTSTEFAHSAETEAAKFLLLKGAVNFYVRGGEYEKAADAVAALQREVKDVSPSVIAEITGKATGKISETKAPRLYAFYRLAKLQVRAADEAKTLAAKLKKVKSDALQRKYAEALAVSGDWKAAYAEFAKVENAKLKEMCSNVNAAVAKNAEAGEFWWTYKPTMEDADEIFKAHAAAFYRKALDAGEITGLKKNIIEQRLKQIEPTQVDAVYTENAGPNQEPTKTNGKVDGAAIIEAVASLGTCTAEEKAQKAVSMLFPGWSLETKAGYDEFGGFRIQHRGRKNVIELPLINRETPTAIGRTVKLSNKYPCLFLSVSSFDSGCDGLLAVRVDGGEAMPFRIIQTTDLYPWEDLVVPLFPWRGREVNIEIIHKANGWWCEHVFLSRIEIAEGTGRERCGLVGVLKEKVNGITWSYQVKDGTARIVSEACSCAVNPEPVGALKIPATLGKVPVSKIGKCAFKGCGSLTSVSFPPSLRHIENEAFAGSGLTSVTIPEGVESIGWDIFGGCASLKAATFSDSMTKIGYRTFGGCRGLTSVRLPKNLAVLEYATFDHCVSLKSVEIPATVTNITTWVFSECEQLRSVVMHGERMNVGAGTFNACPNLKEIHVPAKAKSWAGMTEWQGVPLVFDAK